MSHLKLVKSDVRSVVGDTSIYRLREFELVYVGTPYSKFPGGIEQAFAAAGAIMAPLILSGVKAYSPITHTHPIAVHGALDPYDHDIWLKFDLAMMRKSDAMLVAMLNSWEDSYGIKYEIEIFKKDGKPIFYLDPETLSVRETADADQ